MPSIPSAGPAAPSAGPAAPTSPGMPQLIFNKPKKVLVHPDIQENSVLAPSHPIISRSFPFLCDVCKSPDAKTCSACKSVSYCGRECQKAGWANHKRCCKVFQEMHSNPANYPGVDKSTLACKKLRNNFEILGIKEKFTQMHKREPNGFENEQLLRFARCNFCGKSAGKEGLIVCTVCRCLAYCSKECEMKDAELCNEQDAELYIKDNVGNTNTGSRGHVRGGELCQKLAGTTKAAKVISEQNGSRPGFCSKGESKCDLMKCGDIDSLRKEFQEKVDKLSLLTEDEIEETNEKIKFMQKNGQDKALAIYLKDHSNVLKGGKHLLPWLSYIQQTDFGIGSVPLSANINEEMKKGLDLRSDLPLVRMHEGFMYAILDGLSQQLSVLYAITKLEEKLKLEQELGEKLKKEEGQGSKKSLLSGDVVIHIIGAESEFSGFHAWEEVFHRYVEVESLRIVLIGPGTMVDFGTDREMEVGLNPSTEGGGRKLCDKCVSNGKKFYISSFRMCYEEYVKSEKFLEPTVVVGFNAGIHDTCEGVNAHENENSSLKNAWTPAIEYLVKECKAPVILTSYDKNESEEDVKRCREVAGSVGVDVGKSDGLSDGFRVLLDSYENPFASPLWMQEVGWGYDEGEEGQPALAFTENGYVAVLAGAACALGLK